MEEPEPKNSPSRPVKSVLKKTSAKKFIVFVGNIPYSCTLQDLQDFFKECKPISIRYPLSKAENNKPKGYAFIEFNASSDLQSAILLDKKKIHGRKINVELTAGGGGSKSSLRKQRITDKNKRLKEEQTE